MNHPSQHRIYGQDPATCTHGRLRRIGIQKSPLSPHRLYLVTCLFCGTTVTTISLRKFLEGRGTPPRRRRPAA
jgi:hypothetical protein